MLDFWETPFFVPKNKILVLLTVKLDKLNDENTKYGINIKLRELETQRRQQRTKRHCANTVYILIQSHNAEVGIFTESLEFDINIDTF